MPRREPIARMRVARRAVAAAAMLCACLPPASAGAAGVYHVYSCRIPHGPSAGAPAPLPVAEGGEEAAGEWDAEASGKVEDANTCAGGGALIGGLRAGEEHGSTDALTWQFTAPTGETIKEATLWRAGDADGGEGYLFWLASPTNPPASEMLASDSVFDGCDYQGGCVSGVGTTDEPLSAHNVVKAENLDASHLYINVTCARITCPDNSGDGQGHAAVIYLYAADMLLEETTAPSVSNVSGGLVADEPLSGEASLAFRAQDQGSGVYQQVVEVDGVQLERAIVDPADDHCKPVEAGAEPPAFLYPSPCPATAEGHVTLDTTGLADGAHQLRIAVTNAAGDSSTVLERQIDVANHPGQPGGGQEQPGTTRHSQEQPRGTRPTPNGDPASTTAKLTAHWVAGGKAHLSGAGAASLTAAYGHAQTIRGRLTGAGGKPIAGALIQVAARPAYGGAKTTAMHPTKTGRAGAFALKLRGKESSRSIELSYASTIGGKPVAARTLTLRVRAGVRLHVTPRSVAAGRSIALRGRVLGGPIPKGGKQVVLEARSQGTHWLQFKVLHTDRHGRFHATHRFRLPGPIRYRFRAVCPAEADFPFLAGDSKAVGVREG